MWKIFTAILWCSAANIAFAQLVTVTDKERGTPLSNVILMSDYPYQLSITNADGQASLAGFEKSAKITFRLMGYRTLALSYDALKSQDFSIGLISAHFSLDEVVVSASKWGQSSGDVPNKISALSPKKVALLNPQTAADLLGATGEVFIQKSQQGGGSPMIRGFSANRLLYAVDGVRMNTAIFRGGNLQNVISLDPWAIENTEVFFGPGSIIYGSDAIGGVMSFQTLVPKLSEGDDSAVSGKAVARYSSANDENTVHFDVNVGRSKWASVTSFTFTKYGDLRMGTDGPEEYLRKQYIERVDNEDRVVPNPDPHVQVPTGYTQHNFMQKIRYAPSKAWDIQYALHFSETSEFSRYDRLIEVTTNGLPRSAVWNYGPQKWVMNNLTITQSTENKLYDKATLRLAHQYFEESRIDRNFSGAQRFRLRTNLEKVDAYSANLDLIKNVAKGSVNYGAEYLLNDVTSLGSAIDIRNGNPIAVPDRYPASIWASLAAYMSFQRELSAKVLLQSGVRHSGYRINSDFTRHLTFFDFDFSNAKLRSSATTASLGTVIKPNDTWKVSLNASTGFRAPNVDDIGKIFDFVAGEVIVPNTALKAEYAYNVEANISKIFDDRLKLDATVFYTYLHNAMVRRPFSVRGEDSIVYNGELSRVYAIQNAAFAKVFGFNAGFELMLTKGLTLHTRYNYQVGNEEMDNGDISRSRHGAPAFGVSRLTYQTERLTLQLYAVYSAEVSFANLNPEERGKPAIYAKDPNGNPYSPRWHTFNIKGMYQITKSITASAGLENFTDQRYRPYSSGLVAPGRNLVISVIGRI